jgi:hypothetical protein
MTENIDISPTPAEVIAILRATGPLAHGSEISRWLP